MRYTLHRIAAVGEPAVVLGASDELGVALRAAQAQSVSSLDRFVRDTATGDTWIFSRGHLVREPVGRKLQVVRLAGTRFGQGNSASIYVVQPGDSLTLIAYKLGLSPRPSTRAAAQIALGVAKMIAAANGITDIDAIFPGQRLTIPQNVADATPATDREVQEAIDRAKARRDAEPPLAPIVLPTGPPGFFASVFAWMKANPILSVLVGGGLAYVGARSLRR